MLPKSTCYAAMHQQRVPRDRRAEARTKEREKLLTKAKGKAKEDKSEDKKGGANEARAAFFRRALETAHGLGVVDCQDCKIKTN